ncbi:Transmembrane 4 L6 family member 1 [Dissostichus eleginoides]|uniref:Transmembrane 4 L6 family member 1 n=1 Tax=Dissostichus eleginoides TaxID=100907 RepID=A0AAD9CF45_DISEL|nr:Transmembrane 4 L6 family member 1 [Dissostichus eleginoides]
MAIVCMLCNVLLLFPDLKIHFLLEGHVTREATWAPGLWGSGVLLAARSFLRSSRTSGCFAFRRQGAKGLKAQGAKGPQRLRELKASEAQGAKGLRGSGS